MNFQILFIFIIFLSCILQGIVGFGFALISVPLSLLFFEKSTVVSAVIVISLTMNIFLIKNNPQQVDKKLVFCLFLSSLTGLFIGVKIFQIISIANLQLIAGFLAVGFSMLYIFRRVNLPNNKILIVLAGFLSGLLNTSTSLSGPPIAILLAGLKVDKLKFKKTLAVFFLLMNIVSLILYFANKIETIKGIELGLTTIPFVLVAGYIGDKISHKISVKKFSKIVFIVIFMSGFYSIFTRLSHILQIR